MPGQTSTTILMHEVIDPGDQDLLPAAAQVEDFEGFGRFVTIRPAREGRKVTAVVLSLSELKALIGLAEVEGVSP